LQVQSAKIPKTLYQTIITYTAFDIGPNPEPTNVLVPQDAILGMADCATVPEDTISLSLGLVQTPYRRALFLGVNVKTLYARFLVVVSASFRPDS